VLRSRVPDRPPRRGTGRGRSLLAAALSLVVVVWLGGAAGDLVFYYNDLSHVAIYAGDGKVISAPRPGDVVRMVNMYTGAPINSFGRP
jgi:hypothetical protein